MIKDIKLLLKYLRLFMDAYFHSELTLMSKNEDAKMAGEISRIRNKYNL